MTYQVAVVPCVALRIDGQALPLDDDSGLSQVRVEQVLSAPTLCELVFERSPASSETALRLAPGAGVRVALEGVAEPLFTGQVTAVEYIYGPDNESAISVRAHDTLHTLSKRVAMRAHVQLNPEELARELVSDLGLAVESTASGIVRRRILQHGQSDLELLRQAAERQGLYFAVEQDTLLLFTLEGYGTPLPLVLGTGLHEARFEVSGEPAARSVRALGWDPLQVVTSDETATRARSGRQINAQVEPGQMGSQGEFFLPNQVAETDAQVEALAQAELDRRTAYEVRFWGRSDGDPRLRPGRQVDIQQVAPQLAGTHVLTRVVHVIDSYSGYTCDLSTAPPLPEPADDSAAMTPAIITRVDDPEGLGRVRAALPTFGDLETDWIGVLAMGAGENKGFIFTPDVGDQVLLLYAQGDPDQSIVLGGLYGMAGAPDSGVERSSVQRFTWMTAGGQRIVLDDEQQLIRIEMNAGSYVEMAPSLMRWHASTDLEIEAPGRSIVIKGQAIDFQTG